MMAEVANLYYSLPAEERKTAEEIAKFGADGCEPGWLKARQAGVGRNSGIVASVVRVAEAVGHTTPSPVCSRNSICFRSCRLPSPLNGSLLLSWPPVHWSFDSFRLRLMSVAGWGVLGDEEALEQQSEGQAEGALPD